MYDEYKIVTKLEYDFSLSFIFVILPAMAEGILAVVLVTQQSAGLIQLQNVGLSYGW